MDVSLFDFELPKSRIALRPAQPRDSARMLVAEPKTGLVDDTVLSLADHLRAGDLLVFNDTRVIPSRLIGKRGEAKIELTLHKREEENIWRAFAKPAKKCRLGDRLIFNKLEAEVLEVGEEGERTIKFLVEPENMMTALAENGVLPLPPYIASQRGVDEQDEDDYQTVFAKHEGAVAAPTAGLHFTPRMLDALTKKGVEQVAVTLHVGAGTFLPVKAEDTDDHKMHSEYGEITAEVAQKINETHANGGRVIAVGTTSLRLLESAAQEDGTVKPFNRDTDIFITPGYKFKAVDILMTNFHLPKSTLFMLISAFAGLQEMQNAYAHAIENDYRFYSYGDGCLLFRKED